MRWAALAWIESRRRENMATGHFALGNFAGIGFLDIEGESVTGAGLDLTWTWDYFIAIIPDRLLWIFESTTIKSGNRHAARGTDGSFLRAVNA
ncbi:MAG: hypothetical protein MnENMB40S_14470 [Rhizobiaceae bacterium MnEN-MB40S]|nr:MAG: hypothetical protein MnENMB40S_14470 [Rhizobiaceae bacterium MnEN-MB40S]